MNPSNKGVAPAGSGRWMIALTVVMVMCMALPALGAGAFVQHNTPSYVKTAKNLGAVEASQTIEVSLWLNPHNRKQLDELVGELYDPASSNYRHFLTQAQFAEFAPTAEEAKTVEQFLEAHGLKIVRKGPSNFFVRARGTVAEIEAAFQVKLNRYEVMGKTLRANNRDPFIDDDAAAPLVRAIYGLDSNQYVHPALTRPTSVPANNSAVRTLHEPSAVEAAAAGNAASSSDFFTNNCFNGTETDVFSTNGTGAFPIGTYRGNVLNLGTSNSVGCGYTPEMIQAAYNLTSLYKAGFNGKGQTIGILEFCGSPTIESDANVFSAKFGLPPLNSSNFTITDIPISSPCEQADNVEVNIDVEWAHAIAPGAKIDLLVAPSNLLSDIDEVELTAVNDKLANVLSGSYGIPESLAPETQLENENFISELAAGAGISANFSSGDDGDNSDFGIRPTIDSPADSPFSTAVGGVSLALNSDNSIAWQAGWGNATTLLAEAGTVFNPPQALGFNGGSGGGSSNCVIQSSPPGVILNCLGGYSKPSFQRGVPGELRQIPDISWLADPFTGAVIAVSVPGEFPPLVWQVFGGTSIACPMFSGLWAIANQVAGQPLGQAAPYLYSLPKGAITDIIPLTHTENVTASIQASSKSTTNYNPDKVLGGAAPSEFVSAIWDYEFLANTAVAVSFGTDCAPVPPSRVPFAPTSCAASNALKITTGWDNVTGLGVPNPPEFIKAFTPTTSASDKK